MTLLPVSHRNALCPLLTCYSAIFVRHHFLMICNTCLGIFFVVAKGIVILPKSVTPVRIASNLAGAVTTSKQLDKDDIENLDGIAANGKQKRSVPCFSGVCLYVLTPRTRCRFVTPPWRMYPLLQVEMDITGLFSLAVELGFENWPKLI